MNCNQCINHMLLDEDKTIMVGSDFQAVIPEGLCRYDDALPYENDDKLLWDPTILNESEVSDYLRKISSTANAIGNCSTSGAISTTNEELAELSSPVTVIPTAVCDNMDIKNCTSPTQFPKAQQSGAAMYNNHISNVNNMINDVQPQGKHLRDDEQALYLLQQCGHNVEEALRRRRINVVTASSADTMSEWSEDECRLFENGLRTYGKDFYAIQQFKVRTRSVGELVQFYYLWKKTERHDVFANKGRLEKKKYSLTPGLTDYMDRFLEDNNEQLNCQPQQLARDRSLSPSFNTLLYTDNKRQHRLSNDTIAVTATPASSPSVLNTNGGLDLTIATTTASTGTAANNITVLIPNNL